TTLARRRGARGVARGALLAAPRVDSGRHRVDTWCAAVRVALARAEAETAGGTDRQGDVFATRINAAIRRTGDPVVAVGVLSALHAAWRRRGFLAHRQGFTAPLVLPRARRVVDARQAPIAAVAKPLGAGAATLQRLEHAT